MDTLLISFRKALAVIIGVASIPAALFALFVIHAANMRLAWLASAVILIIWFYVYRGACTLFVGSSKQRLPAPKAPIARRAPPTPTRSSGGSISCGDDHPSARTGTPAPTAVSSTSLIVDDAMNSPAMQAWRARRAAGQG